jgi:hypothetical protein
MPRYQITAEGLADLRVNCPGCSGDALVLALGHWDIQSYQTLRRSEDGRQWWFQLTLKLAAAEVRAVDSTVIRVVSVCRIDD